MLINAETAAQRLGAIITVGAIVKDVLFVAASFFLAIAS